MRRLFSKNNLFTFVWIAFHFSIVAAFFLTLKSYGGLNLDADFTTMLPGTNAGRAAEIAEQSITKSSGNAIFILSSNEDFSKAKVAAETAFRQLKKLDEDSSRGYRKFNSISLYTDIESYSDVQKFIAENRYTLLEPDVRSQIEEDPQSFSESALAKFFGFSMSSADPEQDPFMLDSLNFQRYLSALSDSGAALSPKDGVLSRFFEGRWYVLIRAELSVEGARLANKSNAVPDIYDACFPLEVDGTRFVFFGTPFHSFKSSSNAVWEVKIISAVTIAIIVAILFVVFRSLVPLVWSVLALGASMGTAFLATHAIFGNVHMIGMIFGTSLIGTCIDYSLHFFINWKGSPNLKTGEQIRRHLINGLFLSLVSTEICYLLLMFAPFAMLKQIALFSFVGIMSSFLTTVGILPLLKIPKAESRKIPVLETIFRGRVEEPEDPRQKKIRKRIGKVFITLGFAATIGILAYRHEDVRIVNNLSNLYTMEGRLKDDSIMAFRVIEYDPTSWLIVSGDSEQDVLEREERILPKMRDSFVSTSRLVPSVSEQKRSVRAAERLLEFADEQFSYLGFEDFEIPELKKRLESEISGGKFVSPGDDSLPENLKSILKMVWIGEVDGKYYSVILPSSVSDEEYYISLAESDENLFFVNKIKDVSRGLDDLTAMIVKMFALAFVLIVVVMKFFYNFRDTFKIVTIPLISILVITTTFVLKGLPIEFFCITGAILVFGLGLDYVVYKRQNKGSKTESFAITLSFLTTAISFGAVVFSTFVPVHSLGLSIFSGITAAFLCTML